MIASSLRGSLLAIARGIRDRSSSRVQFAPLSTFIISIVEGIVEKLAWKIRFSLGVVPIFSREAHAFTGIHPSKSNIHAYLRIQRRSKQEKIIMSPFTPFENGGEPILQSFLCLECLRVYRYHAHAHTRSKVVWKQLFPHEKPEWMYLWKYLLAISVLDHWQLLFRQKEKLTR